MTRATPATGFWLCIVVLLMLGPTGCRAEPEQPLPLAVVTDVPIGAPTGRFDYASLDPQRGLLFFADLAGSRVLAFDVRDRRLVGAVPGVTSAHGVLAVPELGRVFASATGAHALVAIDEVTLAVTTESAAGDYPDGVAWDPKERKLYVSDESGGRVAVIDPASHRPLKLIPMGGQVGNTQYDAGSGLIYSNAQGRGDLVGIDPRTDTIVSHDPLPGCAGAHGLLIDSSLRLAFIACEDNAKLVALSLATHARITEVSVGDSPDVLAYDPVLRRLYVASEGGVVTVVHVEADNITKLGQGFVAENAHTVAVDPASHLVYFPLRNVDGRAVLRVMAPR